MPPDRQRARTVLDGKHITMPRFTLQFYAFLTRALL